MSHTPTWHPYARFILRRLQHAERDTSYDAEDENRKIPAQELPAQTLLEALDDLPAMQRLNNEELYTLSETGADGWAIDADGNDMPQHYTAPSTILMCLRLAATFGTHQNFCATSLAPHGVMVIDEIPTSQLDIACTQIGRVFLPPSWTAQTYAARRGEEQVLQLIRPTVGREGTICLAGMRDFEHRLLGSLAQPHPLLVLWPEGPRLDPDLKRILPKPVRLAPVDQDMMLMLLEQTHSATGKIDRARVAPLLPHSAALQAMDEQVLLAALRAPNAGAAASKLAEILQASEADNGALTLTDIKGASPAHQAARDIVEDLTAWHDGKAHWTEIPHSLLISGEPGVGKSVLARAIAASADVPLIEASFGGWQSCGHLGDMLGAMRKSFTEAARNKPSVLFIDEIDSAGARDTSDRHGSHYRRNVINQFLAEVDALMRDEGVLLIGACNHPNNLDPAILRSGRFDRHAELGRPPLAQIQHMLERILPTDHNSIELARAFAGQTPAEIDASLRAAHASARRAGRSCDAAWVMAQMPKETPRAKARQRRIAIHECGHALVATLLSAAPVERVTISKNGGQTIRPSAVYEGTLCEFEDEMTILLGGRAAERILLGDISAGAGGGDGSDLQQATQVQLACDREVGLGIHGNGWMGPAVMKHLTPDERDRLRVKLDRFERRAQSLLEPHRDQLARLAEHLLSVREMDTADLRPWLKDLAPSAAEPVDCSTATPHPQ
ncbi:AAA family ATPase [Phaeobacter gallaeciensis]|uniref:AAA family ATPase n=1 Tax=Phaeobacter gallaeciensis TaxID=60890 RepID=UPI00237F9064|nr:AAA family ATPase [Phaeobacter gallaeciensis]MDE4193030.1 AAA family ATPase [Phaeobacter gallaeciensis]MDE4201259.1 AAA family ATPase [Phaeobacter gallaeciensis]MDE4205528.1 AAA family ATPase [Phaeobacter gallaeciensis]MDE4209582.1 AAA family ATPase [Phaeobacter gallaeciensis]MDE4218034.1 AAA family ATPase [Phaeobacter gallaeciensis]